MMMMKASRHGGTKARRGFSLVEVLMAIFILGIGIISIAALFPAGIAQQRQSVDDVMGPIVAENAMSILRSKLTQEDFGTFEEFSPNYPFEITVFAPRPTIPGDWSGLRPAFIHRDVYPNKWPLGAIEIFNGAYHGTTTAQTEFPPPGGYSGTSPVLYGIPYNRGRHGDTPPAIIFTQEERFYPQGSQVPSDQLGKRPPKPQYVWDCMFRRFQGKVLVAIFVYRVGVPGGEMTEYAVPLPSGPYPPLPIWLDLTDLGGGSEPWRGEAWDAFGEDLTAGTADDALIPYTDVGQFDLTDHAHQWQVAGQWLLGQNNNVHRVLGRRQSDNGEWLVELIRPVPAMPAIQPYYMLSPFDGAENIVTDIWYLPLTMTDLSGQEFRLTPVYLTVKEL